MSQPSEHVLVKRDAHRYCAVCGVRWPCGAKQQEIIAQMKKEKASR